jgi:predicted dehydrogenase
MTQPFGIAIVGIGPAAKPHLQSLYELRERIVLRHAVTRRPSDADMGPFSGLIEPHADLQKALNDPAVRAVIVATAPATHGEIARHCFAQGKHVLLEKPIDTSVLRASETIAQAKAAGLRLGIVLQHRFRPGSQALAEVLTQGRLGRVQAAFVRVPWWRPQSYYDMAGRGTMARDGGGVLMTQAIHSIDLFRTLVGVRRVVAAQVTRTSLHQLETEDLVSAMFELDGGGVGHLMATTALYPGRPESLEVMGEFGSANLEGGSLQVHLLDGTKLVSRAEGGTGSGANIMDFPNDAHRALLIDFVDAVEVGREPVVTGEKALATQTLIDEILNAGARNGDAR